MELNYTYIYVCLSKLSKFGAVKIDDDVMCVVPTYLTFRFGCVLFRFTVFDEILFNALQLGVHNV